MTSIDSLSLRIPEEEDDAVGAAVEGVGGLLAGHVARDVQRGLPERVPAIGVAVEVVEEGADEMLHSVAGRVVKGRVVRVVFPVTEFD